MTDRTTSYPPSIPPGVAGWIKLIAALIAAGIGGGSVGAIGYSALTEYRLEEAETRIDRHDDALSSLRDQTQATSGRIDVLEERALLTEARIFDELRRIRERLDELAAMRD